MLSSSRFWLTFSTECLALRNSRKAQPVLRGCWSMFDQSSTFTLRMVGYVCPKLNLHSEDGGVGLPKAQPPHGACWGYFDQTSTLVLGWTFNDCSVPKEHHILGTPLLFPKNTTFWEHLVLGWTFNDCSVPKEHHILGTRMYLSLIHISEPTRR